ncbi:MAG: DUF2796 domain-containing protein [Rhodospirillales bacterium]|nr:DUF2796 domain-containing protein [Rhodospirillales bacterium]
MLPKTGKFRPYMFVRLSVVFLAFATTVSATEREHSAHEHGVSRLNIAVADNTVQIELMAPGADIVGFEHAATTAADKTAVKEAVATLQDGSALFTLPGAAGCKLKEAEVKSDLAEDEHDGHNDHDHDKEEAEEASHAEFRAHYHFHCDEPGHVTGIDVNLFTRFPTLREIDVQAITSRGQTATELTPASSRLMF